MQYLMLWWQTLLLASLRLTVGVALTPLMSTFALPGVARVILVLSLAILATDMSLARSPALAAHEDWSAFGLAAANEVAAGLLISTGIHAAFAAMTVAGRLIDAQMGFSLSTLLDPVSRTQSAVMSTGMNLLALLLFFFSDAYLIVLGGVMQSFEINQIGHLLLKGDWVALMRDTHLMFSCGLALAAPLVVALLLTDLMLGLLSRNLPQMNVLFLGIPVKIILGLVVIAASVRWMGPTIQQTLLLPANLLNKL